jgi:hypothetical protein
MNGTKFYIYINYIKLIFSLLKFSLILLLISRKSREESNILNFYDRLTSK